MHLNDSLLGTTSGSKSKPLLGRIGGLRPKFVSAVTQVTESDAR
jgi:hypothetical protein